jgi:uncharacterized protein
MDVRIVESTPVKVKKPLIVSGLPETGLVGSIAAMHMVEELKLSEVGFLESDLIPPIGVVHKKRLLDPMRIYADSSLLLVLSEIPVPPNLYYPLSRTLAEWYKTKDPKMVVLMGGIAVPNREDLEKPKVVGVPSDKYSEKFLEENEIEILQEGFLVGIYSLLLKECRKMNIPAVYLMAEAHYGIPDPGAAAEVLEVLNKGYNLKVDVKKLLERDEEIRVMARDLMRRTAESMQEMKKPQEQELPVMYG